MSDMIINDSVPVDKKWNELIKYNIFIMKLVEFTISLIITIMSSLLPKPRGHMYCIATGPTLVISFLFIILYLRRKVPLFLEKMYLFFQILFVFGAFIQVISVVLMILPFLIVGAGVMHCLCVSPSLVMSLIFIVLYLVDQVHALAEQLYLVIQITINVLALLLILMFSDAPGALYGLFYCHLLVAQVTALLLNIIPHVVEPMGMFHCIVAGPTLVLSFMFMVLYIVDQVQNAAEMYYAVFELIMTLCALVSLIIAGKLLGAIYGLFYIDLIIALSMDIHYMKKERGWTF